ncbi:MAG: FAD-dependent oxidoreductase, partial [Proteobacteria bacterium]|nr:FAD-dependent oxidoreductase [Pseudomonadota bacterium]
PADCSAADFVTAAALGSPADLERSAAMILIKNPLGGICGAVCPERLCMAACSRATFDRPVDIPAIQAALVSRAHKLGLTPTIDEAASSGKRVAIIGAGPAGLAAAFQLAHLGHQVELFEKDDKAGGACNLIPAERLPRDLLQQDLDFLFSSPKIELHLSSTVDDPGDLDGFDAVLVAAGLGTPFKLGINGEDAAIAGTDYLANPEKYPMNGVVAVVGGGAVACDCAVTARNRGATQVELFALEKISEMPLPHEEMAELFHNGIHINGRTKVASIAVGDKGIEGIDTQKVAFEAGDQPLPAAPVQFSLRGLADVAGTEQTRNDIQHVIIAIGNRSAFARQEGVVYAGDCKHGPSAVVEAVASGKNAAAEIDAFLSNAACEPPPRPLKSCHTVAGYSRLPVALDTDFFGRTIPSPFILSAAPPTDGYDQMKKAFEAGWAGGIMKTAFEATDIHIPSEYMFAFSPTTYANCDNVSAHSLERVCGEVEALVKEFPDNLVMASTGGPVSGNDEEDALAWQSNTRKLESAGVMGIEYSLSCPQGGDGTEGDIVAQNAAATAKIIDWILQTGDPTVPKLFKLTAAVTSVEVIINAVRGVLDNHPNAKAGVTLANTFPTLGFRNGGTGVWEEGIVVGMSGEGVTPISNLTLAKVANLGVTVSGNGGPMDYKAAADFLALGANTVQFCTIAMKHGYGIIDELTSGLSHLMKERQIASVDDLIGIALPNPITDFMDLSPVKKISACNSKLCVSCGNCMRCGYLAITMDQDNHPQTNPEKCIGCRICTLKCISGALYMRSRTPQELALLKED